MKKVKMGRPPKEPGKRHSETLLIRLEPAEKVGFGDAASLAGAPLAVWIRERLRRAATRELEAASRPVAFLKSGK
jgi:predicted HicB family RNase H-like nuclease